MPAPTERHGDHGLGEKHERDGDREREGSSAAPIQVDVPNSREGVERDRDGRERPERRRCFLAGCVVQDLDPTERGDRPRGDEPSESQAEPALRRSGRTRSATISIDRGGRREARSEDQSERRGDLEPGVRSLEKHPGRRERVETQEPGTREERERYEEQAGVSALRGGLARQDPENHVDDGHAEDQPEVRRMMLPAHVQLGDDQQEKKSGERKQQERGSEDRHASAHDVCSPTASMEVFVHRAA
jgi:hypothetical protein